MLLSGLKTTEAVGFLLWLHLFPLNGLSILKKGVSYRDIYFRGKVKEYQLNFDPEFIKGFTDAVIKEPQDHSFAKRYEVHGFINDIIEMFVFDVFVGGVETILTSIRWFIVFLLHWSHFQDKIHEELINVIDSQRYLSFKDRKNLPFLQARIHESMRLSSISALGPPRKATLDTSVGEVPISKNSIVIFNFWNYHRSPEYWEDPHIFNPYRWLGGNGNELNPGKYSSYLPFSVGIRGCPGEALAKFEMFLFMSRLFRDFQVEKDPDGLMPDLEGDLGLWFQNHLTLYLKQGKTV